jgi:Sulfotransferase family
VIETFEELPTRGAMQLYLDRVLPRAKSPGDRLAAFIEARARYFGEMERKRRKSAASFFVDKSPIRSADAGFMVKAFPGQRYIFSIRHPFDVVLSCFRQAVAPDMAMDGFRTIESAAAFYDFTMTQWFGVYSHEDPRIHYLRYDDLVTQFEPKMREVLAFLGAEWSDSVLDFAAAAQTRPAATPSYQKVRQGLSIGVQSSWRKYGFLFQAPAARPLHKWAEFFGYPTK